MLEPGCGSGNFIGFAPEGVQMVGVELDPTTAAIAASLYPHAQVLAESFADTRAPEGSFDAAVGNVPFGNVRLYDKRHNAGKHAIHNHFIIKSLRLVRPGGLVAVITSAYTMDAANPGARREMQQLADLVGAVRLPTRAHARAAGTEALTDVLVFRRREADRAPQPFTWEYTRPVQVGAAALRINSHFLDRPEMVLGELATGDGLYRADELSVTGDPQRAPAQLAEALAQLAAEARAAGLVMTAPDPTRQVARPAALLPAHDQHPTGYLRALPDATFTRQGQEGVEPYHPPKTQAAELRALLRLRDTVLTLLEAEAAAVDDTDEIDQLRERLNRGYDAYVRRFGPINRFTLRPVTRLDAATGQRLPAYDEHTGEPKSRRVQPPQGGFHTDPYAPLVWGLEHFDDQTQTATKGDIFRQRVVAPRPPRLGADTPAEALAMVTDELGEVRLDRVAWLLGVDETDARQQLGTLVFDDPVTGALEPAAAYLSGDVREKLTAARQAAETDPRFEVNVTALAQVLPRDLGPDEIAIQMGAPWIHERYVQRFLAEILDDPTVRVEHGAGSMWSVSSSRDHTVEATSTWGTGRMSASTIAQYVLEQRPIRTFDTHRVAGTQRRVPNLEETVAANEKATEMRERFAEWAWDDPQRTAELVRTYNDTFNSYVLRSYDNVQLSLPGMATTFQPRPHQLAAVARIINEPSVGLYHTVGAGKTAVMIMGAMELRRLSLVSKPVIVVPNNLLAQFAREFQQLYPRAKVLAATKDDLKADRRRALVGRIATGDWDAVIMTESSFLRLPMSPQVQRDYINRQVADLRKQIEFVSAHGKPMTLKRLEAALARREEKLEAKLDGVKDDGVWFELTGIDYIFRDESDRDKNLHAASNMEGMSIDGSQRASEMDMKLAYLRSKHARWGTRATGTPVANSMIELYTEFRYLRPRLLNQLGITDLDSYLATFAQPVTGIEVTPDGGGLRSKTRVAKFVNVPELLTHLHVLADVKTPDDLDLPRPQLAPRPDGQREPEMIVVQPSDELLDKVAELVQRAEKIRGRRPEAGDDNMLNITHEGRNAALDLRLVGMTTEAPQKLHVAADRIAGIWSETADRVYLDQHGQPHPTPGALQLVFCDLGTPGKNKPWNAYDELRDQLTARGVPRDRIRFIHEAKDDKAKWELFQTARDGRINVLIGSTERMGAGTNVQDRAIALHHLDPQWRPRDIEQREGRIWRQGNQNPDIRILRYVTERSFDAYMWQTLERKAKFINQIMRGSYDGREAEDIGDGAMSYEEVKAAATGNPLLVDHAAAKAELARLERLERAHRRNLDRLRWTISNAHREIEIGQALIGEIDEAIARRIDIRGKAFIMTIADRQYTKRGEANNRLKTILGLELANPASVNRAARDIGTLGGFTVKARIGRYDGQRLVHLALAACPRSELSLTEKELAEGADLVTRLENRLTKLETLRGHTEADVARRRDEIQRAGQELKKPFRHTDALAQARTRFQHLDIEVAALAAEGDTEQLGSGTAAEPSPRRDDHPDRPGTPDAAGSQPRPAPVPAAAPSTTGQPTGSTATPHNGSPDRRASASTSRVAASARPSTVAAPQAGTVPQPAGTTQRPCTLTASVEGWITRYEQQQSGHARWNPRDDQQWIEHQLTQLARRRDIRLRAYANGRDNFTVGFDDDIEEHFANALRDHDPDDPGPGTGFIRAYFDDGDRRLRGNFNPFAVAAIYDAIRGNLSTSAAGAQPAASPDARAAPEAEAERPSALAAAADAQPKPSQVEPIRLEVNGSSVLAHGTSRVDLIARAALKSAGFRWYPSLQAWGMPRNLRPETRHRNISRFRAAMRQAGRVVPVIDKADSEPSPTAIARLSFTPRQPAGTASKPSPTPQESRNPAILARTAGEAPAPAGPRQTATIFEAWSAAVKPSRRPGHARG